MKILVFSHEYPPAVGGAGIVASQLVQVLTDFKHTLTLLTQSNDSIKKHDSSINIKSVPIFKGYWLLSYVYKLYFYSFKKFDRIILNDFATVFVASFLFSKKSLSKSVVFWHGSEDKNIFFRQDFKMKLMRKRYIKVLKKCHKIIAVSNFQKEKMLKSCDLEYLRDKTIVQYAGVDNKIFKLLQKEKRNEIRKLNGFVDTDIILLSVGRVNSVKGYNEMYSIFKQLPNNFHWVIIGEGNMKDVLIENSKKDRKNNIHILGRLDRSILNNYYNMADLFMLFSHPSLQEAFGLVYIEAGLAGLPVIARKKKEDGTNEAVEGIGWLLNNEEAAKKFILRKEYLNIERRKIMEKANRYTLESLKSNIEKSICKKQ